MSIYRLGAYTFDPPEPFGNIEEAVSFIQDRHPEVSEKAIRERLSPKIPENGNNNTERFDGEAEQTGESLPKANKRGVQSNRT
ncbi:hypothetical protein [Chryseobacterium mucoviscidosis]|uniref:hypothetical protein n=1 Tax=Chryseobacterium mucoviscidosis TaxID=1945581 RepID=UPI00301B5092